MKENNVLLTIGMPVFNEERYIGEAIESLLTQIYKDFILIISDNGSTDRTTEICKSYAEKDKRIIFVKHHKNKGSFFNFKYVLDRADTPFFVWAGGHDKCHPQFIEKLLPIIQKEGIVLSYSRTRKIALNGSKKETYNDDYSTMHIDNPIKRYLFFSKKHRLSVMIQGIWKTRILKNCLPGNPIIATDYLILQKASFEGKFVQLNDILLFRRIIRQDESESFWEMIYRQLFMLNGKKPNILKLYFTGLEFIKEHIKIFFTTKTEINIFWKIILSIRIFFKDIFMFYIKPLLAWLAKVFLPKSAYLYLRQKRNKLYYQ